MRCINERELTICYRKRQIDVSFSCVCPAIDSEFRHHIKSSQSSLRVHQPRSQGPLSSYLEVGRERTLGTRLRVHSASTATLTTL